MVTRGQRARNAGDGILHNFFATPLPNARHNVEPLPAGLDSRGEKRNREAHHLSTELIGETKCRRVTPVIPSERSERGIYRNWSRFLARYSGLRMTLQSPIAANPSAATLA